MLSLLFQETRGDIFHPIGNCIMQNMLEAYKNQTNLFLDKDLPKTSNADTKIVPAPSEDMMFAIQDDDSKGNGIFAFAESSEKDEEERSDMEYRSVTTSQINAMPEMLDVLFAAY